MAIGGLAITSKGGDPCHRARSAPDRGGYPPEGGVEDLIVENEWYDTNPLDVAVRSLNNLKRIIIN